MTRDEKKELFLELLQKATNCNSKDLYVLYDHLDWDNLTQFRNYRIGSSSMATIRSVCHEDCSSDKFYDEAIDILKAILQRQSLRDKAISKFKNKWLRF